MDFSKFQRPQRYIGNEHNAIKKSHIGKIKICLLYPDLYEIGMSNLGIRIIYGLLNEYKNIVCERAFMPAEDLLIFLRKWQKKLFSLETKTPLDKFDVVGFHLGCELNYTNFLTILELSRIPHKAELRKKIIVMGGGVANPEPLCEFIDLFYLGEFEQVSDDFVNVLKKYKNKDDRLKAFSKIDGFYVPKFYQKDRTIKRVHVKDFNNSYYPYKWLTPHTEIIHDRAQIEITRGCPNRCTFCQAQNFYSPYRERMPSRILEIIKNVYKHSGYENFSLLGLSTSDHSKIEEIIDTCHDFLKTRRIGLSLPSLRIDDILGPLYKKLTLLKKTSLTVAVEAANSALREKLNKKIDINKLFEAAAVIRSLKIKHIKIYFMFGFPQETEADLIAIGHFINKLSRDSRLDINVSINIFIPKPFSVWEGVKMEDERILKEKKALILSNMPRRRSIKLSFSFEKRNILEAAICRADRKFSSVIYRAYKNGARFDNYRENFSWDIWQNAMDQENIDYRQYLDTKSQNYPWSFIKKDIL